MRGRNFLSGFISNQPDVGRRANDDIDCGFRILAPWEFGSSMVRADALEAWRGRKTRVDRVCSMPFSSVCFPAGAPPQGVGFHVSEYTARTPLARSEDSPVRFFRTIHNRARRFDFNARYRQ